MRQAIHLIERQANSHEPYICLMQAALNSLEVLSESLAITLCILITISIYRKTYKVALPEKCKIIPLAFVTIRIFPFLENYSFTLCI